MHYSKDLSAKEFLLSRINSFLDQKSL